ncbi:hypothetical protein ACN2C6_00175 [Caulobacter sp. ErkDOM-YI]|uniref:hypothetical protein n=1 Tax=unclassified Caulobacter TaxID=2648921 RepID=UPI003AF93015
MKTCSVLAIATTVALASQGVATAAPRTPPPAEAALAEPSTETIAFTQRKSPGLRSGVEVNLNPPGMGLAGMVGAVIGQAIVENMSGAQLARKNQIVDPTPDLARELAWTLAEGREAVVLEQPIAIERQKPKAIAKMAVGARYIVDVRNMGWSVVGSAMYEKDATYYAKLDVIDGRTGAVAVNTLCRWEAPALLKSESALYRPDAGELAKAHFAAGHEACLGQFKIAIRSLYLPSARPPEGRGIAPFPQTRTIAEMSPIETRVATPAAVVMSTLPPPAPVVAPPVWLEAAPSPPTPPRRINPAPLAAAPVAIAEFERWESPPAQPLPPYVEYPYARPYEAPPSRTPPPPEVRYAGRDANGYLTWPGKRP